MIAETRPILEVHGLSKTYQLGRQSPHSDTFRELLQRKLAAPLAALRSIGTKRSSNLPEQFWALRDLTFAVAPGEVVGIIGRNGAGKSTLLKIISRITDPTNGSVTVRGRIASLLEVGTGFHPELTGRENIFLNGAVLGMRRAEILRKFDEIVAFAEVDRFLDTPVKHYSSGMYVRLAFSVAAHLEPEILVVDEVLAVGDVAFQKKCLGKMDEVSRGGRTVLFVSHNMAAIENLCQRGVVLEHGRLAFDGGAKEAVQHYLRSVADKRQIGGHVVDLSQLANRKVAAPPMLTRLEFYGDDDQPLTDALPIGGQLKIRVQFALATLTANFHVGLGFNNALGQRIFSAHSCFEPSRPHRECAGLQDFVCTIPSLTLVPGDYTVRIWLEVGYKMVDDVDDVARFTILASDFYGTGKIPWNGVCVLKQHWQLESTGPESDSRSAAL